MPRGNPAAKHNIRVAPGSALERLVEGKSFTEAVHRMAEVFEQALAEDWGPRRIEMIAAEPNSLLEELPWVEREAQPVTLTEAAQLYEITETDGKKRWVSEQELLAIMGDQMPSALQPVAVVQDEQVQQVDEEVHELDQYAHLI